jgi:hypothetical protein
MSNHSVNENKDTQKRKGAGLFIIGVALFTIGLSIHNVALWIIGMVLVAFAFLVTPKVNQQK